MTEREREGEGETRRGRAPTPPSASSADARPPRPSSPGGREIIIPIRSKHRGHRLARLKSSTPARIVAVATTAIVVALAGTLVARRGDARSNDDRPAGAPVPPVPTPTSSASRQGPSRPAVAAPRTGAARTTVTPAAGTVSTNQPAPVSTPPVVRAAAPSVAPAAAATPIDTLAAPQASAGGTTDAGMRSGIQKAVAEYAAAIGAQDVALIGRVYPGIPVDQRDGWNAFFRDVDDLHATLAVQDVRRVAADVGEVRVSGTYAYVLAPSGRNVKKAITFEGSFARDPRGNWRIANIR